MAEPERRLDAEQQADRVYDQTGTAPSNPRPDLKVLEGGGETTEPKRGHISQAGTQDKPSREDLASAEDSAKVGNVPAPVHENQVGRGYHPGRPTRNPFSLRGRLTKRRAAFGGGILGLIISLVLFFVASGPLEFIHLSQVLQKNFFHTTYTVQLRNKGLFRYARTGQVEETRLGKLGSIVYNRALAQMKDQGITFERNSRGVPDSMTIDTSQNDNYKDLSPAAREDAIIRDFNISDPSIISEQGSLGSGVFKIDLTNTTLKGIDFVKATTKTAIGSLNNGKVETGLSFRYLKQAWDLPSLWSPLDKLKSVAQNNYATPAAEKQAADQAEADRTNLAETAVADSPEAIVAKGQFKNAIDAGQSIISKTVLVTAGMCAIRDAADAAVEVNRAVIVLPSTIQAADKIAIGSQVQSGQNFDTTQLGAVKDSFTDPNTGKTIWSAKALQATEGVSNPVGPDLPSEYAQAFSGKTTADNIRNAIQINLPGTGINITDITCSTYGQLALGVISIAILIANMPDGETGSFAAWAGEQAATAAAFGGITYSIVHFGSKLLENNAVPAVLSGPLGGNVMAYGARELSNVGARSMGGVALANTDSSVLTAADQQLYNQQFNSEPLAQRLFNVDDSRSAISKLIDNVNPNPQNVATSIGNMFTHFGSYLGHSFASLSPPALAASTPYNWGFPIYGIPDSLAQDPKYEDPYSNADYVAKNLLDTNATDSHGMTYISKAMACFGVNINKDSGSWDVVAQNDVNPDSDSYAAGNCNDADTNWQRTMLFVTDSRLMDAIACHQNVDDQSCTNLGESSSAATSTGGGGPGSSGTSQSPFPGGWIPNRLDMGFDGTFSGKIVAPFSGTITYASGSFTNWGGYLELKGDQQPNGLPTSTLYFAEGLSPLVSSGQHVNAGDPIASSAISPYNPTPSGNGDIEWGVAIDGSVGTPTNPYATALGGGSCSQGQVTPASRAMVLNFYNWARQSFNLGATTDPSAAGCG